MADREFDGVGDVDRAKVIAIHQADHALDQIIHVAIAARMAAIAIEDERFAAQVLHNEVAHHAAIIRQHAQPIGVEDPHHPDLHAVHALAITEGFGDALAFVVTAAEADRVHAAAIALQQRMFFRINLHLAGAGQQELGTHPLGQAEHVVK